MLSGFLLHATWPFTLLDLTGERAAQIARDHPSSVCVVFQENPSPSLFQPNIIILGKPPTPAHIETLLQTECFDAIIQDPSETHLPNPKCPLIKFTSPDAKWTYILAKPPGISLAAFLNLNGVWPASLPPLLHLDPQDNFIQGTKIASFPYSPKKNLPTQALPSSLPKADHIHFLYTSALIPAQYEERKAEYIRSLQAIRSFGYEPWIIEATNIDHSFFDDLGANVLYPKQNNPSLKNLTTNELRSLLPCLSKLPFKDDDLIIKITGRYLLFDDYLLQTLIDNPGFDLYAENWLYPTNVYGKAFLSTGCFAMKWSLFKKMLYAVNLHAVELTFTPFERILGKFAERNQLKFYPLQSVHMIARSGNSREIYIH